VICGVVSEHGGTVDDFAESVTFHWTAAQGGLDRRLKLTCAQPGLKRFFAPENFCRKFVLKR